MFPPDVDEYPLPPVIDCTVEDLEQVRKHEELVSLDVQDFVHQSSPIHGVAASTWSSENNWMQDPESALGRLHRPTIAELLPPHTVDSVFVDLNLKGLYLVIFRGEYSIIWMHTFPDGEAMRTGWGIGRFDLVLSTEPAMARTRLRYIRPDYIQRLMARRSNIVRRAWISAEFVKGEQ